MHVSEQGRGKAVVLIGGCPTPASIWDGLVRALATTHRVLVPHLPGYEGSEPLRPYSLAGAQKLIEDALLERGVGEAALVGYSLGAWRVLAMALGGRIRPTAVVCLGGGAHWSDEERAVLGGFVQLLRSKMPLPDIMPQRMVSPGFLEAHPESADEVRAWLEAAPREVIADELEAAALHGEDLRPRLRTLECPVLARTGELDLAAPPEMARAVAESARHGTLQIVPGMGHAWSIEDPAGTSAALARFLG
jgi:pimeloyl-ACP methyl ester carboxylesterase